MPKESIIFLAKSEVAKMLEDIQEKLLQKIDKMKEHKELTEIVELCDIEHHLIDQLLEEL